MRAPFKGHVVSHEDLTVSLLVDEGTFDLGSGDARGERQPDIPVYFRPCAGARKLLVLLPGAIDRGRYDIVFQRASWAPDYNAHVLSVSDPTVLLAPHLALGWFQGTHGHTHFAQLAGWIAAFAKQLRIPACDVVLYGSSAGGFAGLKLTEFLPEPTVMAINPQMFLDRYAIEHDAPMLAACYPVQSRALVERDYYDNLRVHLDTAARTPPTLIVINTLDKFHHREHVRPYLHEVGTCDESLSVETLGQLEGFHSLTYSDIATGHAPPGREVETKLINAVLTR